MKSYGRSRAQMLLGLSKLSTKAVIDALREVWDTPLEYVTLDDVFRPLENLAKSGNVQGIEEFARNYVKQNGKDFDQEFSAFR